MMELKFEYIYIYINWKYKFDYIYIIWKYKFDYIYIYDKFILILFYKLINLKYILEYLFSKFEKLIIIFNVIYYWIDLFVNNILLNTFLF